jgi:hypothetical protein
MSHFHRSSKSVVTRFTLVLVSKGDEIVAHVCSYNGSKDSSDNEGELDCKILKQLDPSILLLCEDGVVWQAEGLDGHGGTNASKGGNRFRIYICAILFPTIPLDLVTWV